MGKLVLRENLALVGFMGVGKTTVYETLGRMGLPGVDVDALVVQLAGRSIPEIFAQEGEDVFRQWETQAIRQAAAGKGVVISCGGGAVLRRENVDALQATGKVVLLTATPETILERLKEDDTRPNLRGRKTVAGVQELMDLRQAYYDAAAQIVVATDGKTPEQVCREILAQVDCAEI